jgi:hypothetical protein
MNAHHHEHAHAGHHHSTRGSRSWRDYLPLLVLIVVSLLVASAISVGSSASPSATRWMQAFMGFFLVVFATLKLFDLPTFADGFQMYDLLAKSFRPYALAYPSIELLLGLGYLARWQPTVIYAATVIVLGFGALGVIRALRRKLDIECACMGTILKVPLSTVALTEDLVMVVMAAAMWIGAHD